MLPPTLPVHRRRGTITPFFLIALVILMAALAVAIDYSFLSETRVEMQNTTDAAALAGADIFVDDSTLFNSPTAAQNLIAASRQEAIDYGQRNRVAGQPLVLSPNPHNFADSDIVFGMIDDPATKVFVQAQNLNDPTNTFLTSINAVRIIGRRTKANGNPAGTLASRSFGLSFVDMTTTSTAMLDHNVIGFRPNTSQPLPLAPLAILSNPANPTSWEFNVTQGNGPPTANGLHGIVVQLTTNGTLLTIGTTTGTDIASQLQTGVTAANLSSFGGQFVLDATNQLIVPGPPALSTADNTALEAALNALAASAAQRVFPLYSTFDAVTNEATLSGFVAARVVSVQPMVVGQPLTFVLQPTVVAVSAAVTDASRRGVGGEAITNPYVVKVRLVE
jgi:hypothetical protein